MKAVESTFRRISLASVRMPDHDVQPLQHHDEPSGDPALFRVINRYVGNLAPMPGVFRTTAPYPQHRRRHRDDPDALGYAAATAHRWAAGDQHPQHVIAALARLAEAREPLLGPIQQLRRIRARAEPGDQEKGRRLVRDE